MAASTGSSVSEVKNVEVSTNVDASKRSIVGRLQDLMNAFKSLQDIVENEAAGKLKMDTRIFRQLMIRQVASGLMIRYNYEWKDMDDVAEFKAVDEYMSEVAFFLLDKAITLAIADQESIREVVWVKSVGDGLIDEIVSRMSQLFHHGNADLLARLVTIISAVRTTAVHCYGKGRVDLIKPMVERVCAMMNEDFPSIGYHGKTWVRIPYLKSVLRDMQRDITKILCKVTDVVNDWLDACDN